jgi:hypothetical protein
MGRLRDLRPTPRRQAALAAGDDQPGAPPVDAADTYREVRVVDGVVIQNLSTSPSFFASTTILIIGGLLAVLGTADKASELARELPFAARTSALVFDPEAAAAAGDLRLRVLPLHLVDAAVHLRRAARRRGARGQALHRAEPVARGLRRQGRTRGRHGGRDLQRRPARLLLRLRRIGWFFSPIAFMAATVGVVYILYQREFGSEVLGVLTAP